MDWLFRAFGVNWKQFKVLLKLSIQLDFRSHLSGGGSRRKLPPMVIGLLLYGIMGVSLAVSLAPKTTPFFYSLLIFTYSMVMMAFFIVLEFENTLFNPDDREILAFRPVQSRTTFLAKICNLLFFGFLMGTGICLLPAWIGLLITGTPWTFPLVFYVVAVLANLAISGLMVLLYTGLLKAISYERFRDVLVYLQIGFAFTLFFVYQLILRAGRDFLSTKPEVLPGWLLVTPPAWFASMVYVGLGWGGNLEKRLALIGIVSLILLFVFSLRRVSSYYGQLNTEYPSMLGSFGRKEEMGGHRGLVFSCVTTFFHDKEMIAGFRLTSHLLKRDRTVKMGVYPAFGIPLAVLVLAILEKELIDPFVVGPFSGVNNTSSLMNFFVLFMIYFFLSGLLYTRDFEAAWIYSVFPIVSAGKFYRGVKLAVLIRLMVPFYLILGVVYCAQIPFSHGLKHVCFLFIFGLVAFSAVSMVIRDYPFSKKREKGERVQPFAFIYFVVPCFGIMMGMQILAYQNAKFWWFSQIGLLMLFFTLEVLATSRLDRVLPRRRFLS